MGSISESGIGHLPLPEKRRSTIGYVTPYIWGDLSISILKGIIKKARDLDVNLICYIGNKLNDRIFYHSKANIAYHLIDCNMLDGLVIWGSQIFDDYSQQNADKFFDQYQSVPIVSIAYLSEKYHSVYLDDYAAVRQIISHLIEVHACRKIAFVRGPENHFNSNMRLEGYKKTLEEYGIPYREELVTDPGKFEAYSGTIAAKQLFQERNLQPKKDIDAIISPSDLILIGVSRQLEKYGIRVPEDVALAGFNNKSESRVNKPALTTIDPLYTVQGLEAMDMIVRIVQGKEDVPDKLLLPGKLVIRQSCGCQEPAAHIAGSNSGCEVIDAEHDFKILNDAIGSIGQQVRNKVELQVLDTPECWIEDLLVRFAADLKESASTSFIDELDDLLRRDKNLQEHITIFQNVISEIRGAALPLLKAPEIILKATDLWNQARVQVHQAIEYVISQQALGYDEQLYMVHFTDQLFMATFDLAEMMNALERILSRLGIPGCYISIYENQDNPLEAARLIFAYRHEKRVAIENMACIFPPRELVPVQLIPQEERYTWLVHPLFFRDKQMGVVIFEPGPIDKAVYCLLAGQLSSALHRTFIFSELKKAEEERKNLLETLELKNLELERRIEERTADIKNVNARLKTALEDANSANIAKSRFLANMSHEIRTPLNCIAGFAEIISGTDDISQHRRYINLIMEETRKLVALINQILDISKIEAGKFELNKESFNLLHFTESITSTYAAVCQGKGLAYELSLPADVPEMLHGDQVRLRQILINLIGNAIKFTHAGSVKISIEKVLETDKNITLLFKIIDTGIGIPLHRQNAIFDTFVQAEDSTTRKFGGTGLGTAISKQLVKLMDGEIGVKSREGEGSTFWFTAVFGKVENALVQNNCKDKLPPEDKPIPRELMEANTIMLVEDYPINRELALVHLSNLGCKVVVAENGVQAVEKFLQHEIDLILMDVQMPQLDGCEATKIIRRQETGKDVPIIGLTANVFESDVILYYEAGMDDILTKPFSKNEFQNKIISWLRKSREEKRSDSGRMDFKKHEQGEEHGPSAAEEAAIDIEGNLKELDGDREFFLSITLEFIQYVREQIPFLLDAVIEEDFEKVSRESHKIKGGALNLAAKPLAELAYRLESKGKQKDLANAQNVIQEIRDAVRELERYLEKNFAEES